MAVSSVAYKNKRRAFCPSFLVIACFFIFYSKLVTETKTYLSNYGISTLEDKLNGSMFIRVHRSSMINLKWVKELNKYTKSYDVIMKNGDVVWVSRGYMDNIKALMF